MFAFLLLNRNNAIEIRTIISFFSTYRAATGTLEQGPLSVGQFFWRVRPTGTASVARKTTEPPDDAWYDAEIAAAESPFKFVEKRFSRRHCWRSDAESPNRITGITAGRSWLLPPFHAVMPQLSPPPPPPPSLDANGIHGGISLRSFAFPTTAAQSRPTFPSGRPALVSRVFCRIDRRLFRHDDLVGLSADK